MPCLIFGMVSKVVLPIWPFVFFLLTLDSPRATIKINSNDSTHNWHLFNMCQVLSKHYFQCFTYINSFNPHSNSLSWVYYQTYLTEKLTYLPKFIQLICDRVRIGMQVILFQAFIFLTFLQIFISVTFFI